MKHGNTPHPVATQEAQTALHKSSGHIQERWGSWEPHACCTGRTQLNLSPFTARLSLLQHTVRQKTRRGLRIREERCLQNPNSALSEGEGIVIAVSTSTCCCARTAQVGSPQSRSDQHLSCSTDSSRQATWLGLLSVLQAAQTATEQESCELQLPSLHQIAARWQAVTEYSF